MLSLLLLPLQAAVILILHACFAFSRLVTLLQQVYLQRRPTTSSASVPGSKADIERDQARWKKTPRKLAVSFVPGTRWSSAIRWWKSRRERELDDERAELAKLVEDTRKLLTWCDQLGIEELSLYDEQGIFDRHAPAIVSLLSSSCTIVQPLQPMSAGYSSFKLASAPRRTRKVKDELSLIRAEVDSGCGVSDAGADGTASPPPSSSLLVNFLSRRAGRTQLARVAQDLASECGKSLFDETTLTTDAIEERVEAGSFAEPDLLVVLGGPYLRLKGFPPWQIRLTEMYHHPSPGWLAPPVLTWPIMRRGLDVFGGAEMRLGR